MMRARFVGRSKSGSDEEAAGQPARDDRAFEDVPRPFRILQAIATMQERGAEEREAHDRGTAAGAATALPQAGRHQRKGLVSTAARQHGRRFTLFSLVGAAVFVLGTAFQWFLIRLGGGADLSYAGQAVFSIELSFALNRWLTWRNRELHLLTAAVKWNTQKLAMSVPNFLGYALLVYLGLNWLAANLAITAMFTMINYVGADLWSFRSTRRSGKPVPGWPPVPLTPALLAAPVLLQPAGAGRADELAPPQWAPPWTPTVTLVIPCKDNPGTIGATVAAILAQDYPALEEVILVGSPGDTTWAALADVKDPRLIMLEQDRVPGRRDPAVKRDTGIRRASGTVVALVDSDIVMDTPWLSRAVGLLDKQGRNGVICGGMRAIHNTFWGRFVDGNQLGAKTPRISVPYYVTTENFGRHNRKPPITANVIFARDVYDSVPLDRAWGYGYEDYEWFWRVARAGHQILLSDQLNGRHHHRGSFRQLVTEYSRSADGCTRFVRAHPDSPLARKRLQQAVVLPLAALAALMMAGALMATGYGLAVAAAAVAGIGVLMAREFKHSQTAESLTYPVIGGALGLVFTAGLVRGLVRSVGRQTDADAQGRGTRLRAFIRARVSWPLTAILAVQSALSLSLVLSNTAFSDEANYLLQGRLEWGNWLHGFAIPAFHDSGAPQFYPPLGAVASAIGGLTGARILSLCFMLAATVLLYLTAKRLFGPVAALTGSALWAVSEPVLRLAFATYDPMSVFLVALAAWLALKAGYSRRRGEFVAASGIVLALASLCAFSFAIMIPVVIAFAFLVWCQAMGARQARFCAAWLLAVSVLLVAGVLTFLHLWHEATGSTVNRATGLSASVTQVARSAWSFTGLLAILAVAGAVLSLSSGDRSRRLLMIVLAGSAFLVPAYQAYIGVGWSLDKHMAAGVWFAALAAGYACSRLLTRGALRPVTIGLTAGSLLVFPTVTGWIDAWQTYHLWPNETTLVSALRPLVARTSKPVAVGYSVSASYVPQYYLMTGHDWIRWEDHKILPKSVITQRFGVIVLGYDGNFGSSTLPGEILSSQQSQSLGKDLLRLSVGGNQSFYDVTRALESDPSYRLAAIIPYTSDNTQQSPGVYVIWTLKSSHRVLR